MPSIMPAERVLIASKIILKHGPIIRRQSLERSALIGADHRGASLVASVSDREALADVGRTLQFIDHCDGKILNGDVALPIGVRQELVAAKAELSCPLPRF